MDILVSRGSINKNLYLNSDDLIIYSEFNKYIYSILPIIKTKIGSEQS